MTTSTVHVVFSDSAAGSLRRALRAARREDRVACHIDNLALGPINPPDPELRSSWFDQELGWDDDYERVRASSEVFWNEALQTTARKVAWVSRRSAVEYTGFLEWLWRLDQSPCEVVDLTDMSVVHRRQDGTPTAPMPALTLALVRPESIIENGLMDRAEPLLPVARKEHLDVWRGLRSENAPLRVVDADGLRSAPLTFFDAHLLSCATREWQRSPRVVAEVMAKQEEYFQAGDRILITRLGALVELGRLEERGDPLDFWASEVRLPG